MEKENYCYKVSDINITVECNHEIEQMESFLPFIVNDVESNYTVQIKMVKTLPNPVSELIVDEREYSAYWENGEYVRIYHEYKKPQEKYAIVRWDWKNKIVQIRYLPYAEKYFSQSGNTFFHIGLESILLREQRLIFHAACVETIWGGILFCGVSGAGKSTQAVLWEQYREAVLINGDRPIISQNGNEILAWGSPYAGSSHCYKNQSCKVAAIVRVVQSKENKVVRLSKVQAFVTVYAGITINDWSKDDVEIASNLVKNIVERVPVYELYCTKDEKAVEVLENTLRGDERIEGLGEKS